MRHLREWQRYQIAAKLEAGCTKKEIAEYLHVHPSTITREIQRNGYSRYRCYRPRIAQERAAHRWRCRHLPRRFKEDVRKKVDEMILMDYSPEQIVGVCRKQGIRMVSHETIYQYIWWDKAHGGELYKHLRHRGRRTRSAEPMRTPTDSFASTFPRAPTSRTSHRSSRRSGTQIERETEEETRLPITESGVQQVYRTGCKSVCVNHN